jgi:hypothetical protein
VAALDVLAQLPEQTGDFRVSPTIFIVLMFLGFVIGTFGHIIKSRLTVGVGVGLIFLATVALPLAYTLSH